MLSFCKQGYGEELWVRITPSDLKSGRKNIRLDVDSYHKSLSFRAVGREVGVRAIVRRGKRGRKYDL
jgi:hypothetical protein